MSLWDLAAGGCKPVVKELSLKGIREARCRPPRSGAWLRESMVSSNEADFDLRETAPLPRNILHTLGWHPGVHGAANEPMGYRGWLLTITSPKDEAGNLVYPASVRDTTKSGMGRSDNRHLPSLAESFTRNVGGLHGEISIPSMKRVSVGGPIVVRARESRIQGEGGQGIDVRQTNSQRSPWESLVSLVKRAALMKEEPMTASAGSRRSLESPLQGNLHGGFGGEGEETPFGCAPCPYPTERCLSGLVGASSRPLLVRGVWRDDSTQ
jgi:hypothetical protein